MVFAALVLALGILHFVDNAPSCAMTALPWLQCQ